ncbi:7TM diverse intracellular signaling domain-containing protein [Olivibacter sitiensis]|uniref:7TM diverse intracellular signaling domain-containing protein n=1 Tax=Olivibacter sitiensis TaxID=376470 RepID=UPI00056A341C|nr:7TM diverse intracellular signaling domain-containing protein [Olivibacter sitiensis]
MPKICAYLFALLAPLFFCHGLFAQRAVRLVDSLNQHIFTYGEIEQLYDKEGKWTLSDIRSKRLATAFKASKTSTPQNKVINGVYWYKVNIDFQPKDNNYLLEFFDQTIDLLEVYLPDSAGRYKVYKLGDEQAFFARKVKHKNFIVPLSPELKGPTELFFKVRSRQVADIIVVLRSADFFINYSNGEYFSFGLFYGMIAIFCFYNLLMFFAVRQPAYLYYVGYMLSVAMYELCTDGVAFQYLWPSWPEWNQYAFAVVLCSMSVFAMLFAQRQLLLRRKAPKLHRFINYVIALRISFLVFAFLFDRSLLNYKFLEAVPLLVTFGAGIYSYARGYQPARYFVLGYGILFFGYSYKFLIMLGADWLNVGIITYYIMSFSFILEMTFLSLAVGDRVRMMKEGRERAQRRVIEQMKINERLKDKVNRELEAKVIQRTRELIEKNAIIEKQNLELTDINKELALQKEQIAQMNQLLSLDNEELKVNVEQVTKARAMSTNLSFDEFSKVYPDQDACLRFLAELKWRDGYRCKKCGHDQYYVGNTPYARRCALCKYDESATVNTVIQNVKIPIAKCFYLIYLIYSTKGKISSHKLSEILNIRQATCWAYSNKIREKMDAKKRELKGLKGQGWDDLLI